MKPLLPRILFLTLSLGLLWQMPLQAAEEPTGDQTLCPSSIRPNRQNKTLPDDSDQRIHLSSDSATVDNEALTTFTGNVHAQQADRSIQADYVRYDRRTGEFEANGNLIYSTSEMTVSGDSANMNLNESTGTVENANYFTGVVNGRGTADRITIKSPVEIQLDEATYTTCPPDDNAWQLVADEIHLDKSTSQGTASGVVLKMSNIPIMYLPYIRFPISDARLTGLLYPGIGTSNKRGTEISIPFYWNIAPNLDATINARNMSRRGLMLENEFRYLTGTSKGGFEYSYLDDKLYGDRREKVSWTHSVVPEPGWSSTINYNYVSDVQYLEDFSSSLGTSSVTYLDRRGQLDYNSEQFVVSTLFQDHQNISGEQPYKRQPQIQFNTRFSNEENRLNYDVNTELVNFDHKNKNKVIGQRVKVNPYVSYPIRNDAGFFIPKLALHYLSYNLDQNAASQNNNVSVAVPVLSMDTGLFLERDTNLAGTGLLHTLEPRLYYLYAPYKNQDDLPVFDTALTTFSDTFLFSENRFSGNDRIGDANQLTAALTTRFYRQDSGQEVLNATLGQIVYFRDRQVTLPGQSVDSANRSSYIASLSFTPNSRVKLSGEMQWNPRSNNTEVGNSRLQYDAGGGRVINLHQRFRRNELRTQGASFAWRTGPAWQFFGGSEYDLENGHRLQNFLGVRYDNCCWGVRFVGIERFNQTLSGIEPRYENAFYVEIELKGLSSLGSRKDIDRLLENGILGYNSR